LLINGCDDIDIVVRNWLRMLFVLLLWVGLSTSLSVSAAVTGPCTDCHTMHRSQNGQVLSTWGDSGPYAALLTVDCIGCHTGENAVGGKVPFVMPQNLTPDYGGANGTGTEPSSTTLAGGSFYWVLSNDTRGHNVAGYCNPDSTMVPADGALPPGFAGGRAAGDGTTPGGGSWPANRQITCAGTYGCHGSHATESQAGAISGGHHALSGPSISTPLNTPADYRMLVGIAGIEDSAWELRPLANRHNQYHGVDNPGNTDTETITYFCSQCHGRFHFNDDTAAPSVSPWLRHPTNYDMSRAASGDYAKYNEAVGVGIYSLVAPVASDQNLPSNQGVIQDRVMEAGSQDDAVITCLSCHRAHGSPYYKSMRWNYAGSVTGGDCAICHTSKN
jgi:hypothetical protein